MFGQKNGLAAECGPWQCSRTVLDEAWPVEPVGVGPQLCAGGDADMPSQLDGSGGAVRAEHVREP